MIGSQCSGLSYLTSGKSVLNQQKLTYFAKVSWDRKNTILEKNTLYICKSIQFIYYFYIYITIYSSYYLFKSSHLIIDLDFAICAIVESMSFLLYYSFYTFTHYIFAYNCFSIILRANYNNIPPKSSLFVDLLWVSHLHPVFSYNYSCK